MAGDTTVGSSGKRSRLSGALLAGFGAAVVATIAFLTAVGVGLHDPWIGVAGALGAGVGGGAGAVLGRNHR